MRENIFRVYCEFEFEGKIIKSMESPASWFLLTQTGKLWTYNPGEAPRPLGKEYKIAIPLFYTGKGDKGGKEIYEGDLIQNETGRICEVVWCDGSAQWDALFRKLAKDDNSHGFSPDKWSCCVKIIGNKWENSELLKEVAT